MLTLIGLLARQCRPLHLLAAAASLIFLGTILHLRPMPRHDQSPLEYYIHNDQGMGRPLIETEGLALGKPFTTPVNLTNNGDPALWLFRSLKTRFAATLLQNDLASLYPNFSLQPKRCAKTLLGLGRSGFGWQRNKQKSVVSFAINLRNSEAIVPAQSLALLEAVALLLKNNKVYISIYENGSEDKTANLLADLGAALQAVGVEGLWIHSSRMLSDFIEQDRIVMLSVIRNLALALLIPYATDNKEKSTLLFLDDIMTCFSNILELVHQQRLQHASMVIEMDWGTVRRDIREGEPGYLPTNDSSYNPSDPPHTAVPRLYDTWVARGINGELPYDWAAPGGFTPVSDNETWVADAFLTQSDLIRQRWLDGRPFPVYRRWGGMAAFDASLFTDQHLRFRSSVFSGWIGGSSSGALGSFGRLVSADGYLESDCPGASERDYIARDIWHLQEGKARIVLAPQARTTYNLKDWLVMVKSAPVTPRLGPDGGGDLIDWTSVALPESVDCIASRTRDGQLVDTWSESHHRVRLNPWWTPSNGTTQDSVDDHLTDDKAS